MPKNRIQKGGNASSCRVIIDADDFFAAKRQPRRALLLHIDSVARKPLPKVAWLFRHITLSNIGIMKADRYGIAVGAEISCGHAVMMK